MYDLIIIGGGPAGITAGIYALRKKLKTLLISKDFIGQVGSSGKIENWPGEKSILGPELILNFKEHLDEYNPEIFEGKVSFIEKTENFKVIAKGKEFFSSCIILATGRKPKKLNIQGEEDFIGKGVVYCTTCDAPLFQGKQVLIVGGGNAGVEAAIELTDYTDKISLFEASSSFSADETLIERAKEKNIKLFKNRKIKRIEGDSFVRKVYYEDLGEKEEKSIDVEGVFVQIGSVPVNDYLSSALIDFNENKEVVINHKTQETKTKGLFAAGDITNVKDKQIIVAAGEGAKAALSAYDYLKKNYKND